MTEVNQEVKAEEVAAPVEKPKKAKKEPKERKKKREDVIVELYQSGITDCVVIAQKLKEMADGGILIVRENLRKAPMTDQMWLGQAKWYVHHAKIKGLIDGPVKIRGPRKKKEEVTAAPVVETKAPVAEEDMGVL